jgi:hypothetical protein
MKRALKEHIMGIKDILRNKKRKNWVKYRRLARKI